MRKKAIAQLLCAALLLTLSGCGASRTETNPQDFGSNHVKNEPLPMETEDNTIIATLPETPQAVEASFPLLARPFSEAESEAMANHNARRCSLMVVNFYYCRCLYADGSCALVRYEIIDNNLRHRTKLVPDCPADYLSEHDGRLYYLNASGVPESVGTDGTGCRVELEAACLSLQIKNDTLFCLLSDGTLLALRGDNREALVSGCAWAFVSEQGIIYTTISDGRVHLFDPSARTDVTLTSEAALTPMIIGTTLFFAAEEPDGRHICALELSDGTQQRLSAAFRGEVDYYRDWDGHWQMRLTAFGGAAGQQTIPCAEAFNGSLAVERVQSNEIRRCRGVDDLLRTDELFSSDGTVLGFELVLPGGGSYPSLAADNEPEK